jgi:hypothetical protein
MSTRRGELEYNVLWTLGAVVAKYLELDLSLGVEKEKPRK